MKIYFTTWMACLLLACNPSKAQKTTLDNTAPDTTMATTSLYDFKVDDLSGQPFDFAQLKGKKVMIVNTASECGNTPQYADLQILYEKYGPEKFTIIGFPANNFGAQEPGSNAEIATFCERNYGVTFPMMSKISVKGSDMHPLYQFLTQKEKNGKMDSEVEWNFQKYLINEKGEIEKIIDAGVSPDTPEVIEWIEN